MKRGVVRKGSSPRVLPLLLRRPDRCASDRFQYIFAGVQEQGSALIGCARDGSHTGVYPCGWFSLSAFAGWRGESSAPARLGTRGISFTGTAQNRLLSFTSRRVFSLAHASLRELAFPGEACSAAPNAIRICESAHFPCCIPEGCYRLRLFVHFYNAGDFRCSSPAGQRHENGDFCFVGMQGTL